VVAHLFAWGLPWSGLRISLSLFKQAPKFYLELTRHTIVCPACLSEKTISFSIPYKHNNETLYFCHCPYCMELFKKNPDYYLDRLAGVAIDLSRLE